jgi:hypothetical protein
MILLLSLLACSSDYFIIADKTHCNKEKIADYPDEKVAIKKDLIITMEEMAEYTKISLAVKNSVSGITYNEKVCVKNSIDELLKQ